MALASGMAAQFGMATEVTPGTAVTVTRFWPFREESLADDRERLEDEGIVAGRRVLQSTAWNGGNIDIKGDVGFNLYDNTMGILFKHMFGGVATTGVGPYVHTFKPNADILTFTAQVGRPGVAGVVHPFTYTGCKITNWEMAVEAGAITTLNLGIAAMNVTTATALATAIIIAPIKPVKFNHLTTGTIGGAAVNIKSLSITGDNALDTDRRFLGSQNILEPLEAGIREYTGTIGVEFTNLTHYTSFVNGTEQALVLTFTVGSNTYAITGNIRFDGAPPSVSDRGLLMQEIPIKFVASGADETALTMVLTNGNATP